ncbi:hypothetical protein OQA88_21 [Cercophora sp. LCS_1]
MADPFTVLGATSSIITLVEFSWKLLSSAETVYQLGESEDHAVLSTIAEDVKRLATPIVASPDHDQSLRDLVEQSVSIAQDLLEALEALKIQGEITVWKSFLVALKDVWKKKKIEAFSHRLAKLQSQVASHVQMVILGRVSDISRALADVQRANKELGINMQMGPDGLREHLMVAAEKVAPDDLSYEVEMKREFKIRKHTERLAEGFVGNMATNLRDLSGTLTNLRDAGKTAGENLHVLRSLYFNQIRTRHKKIAEAHTKTFEWIFRSDDPEDPRSCQAPFKAWLLEGDGVFWIQGKPGSGKSTLMEFISHHPKTEEYLKSWANGSELVLARYYFWHAGSPLQKSQEGLLRSILFDILRRFPALIPRVIAIRASNRDELDNDWSWSVDELVLICCAVLREESSAKFRIFLDGLDEYDEGSLAPEDLVKGVQALACVPNVKLCVSSRPWSVFADAFGSTDRSLRLEDLTRRDIYR